MVAHLKDLKGFKASIYSIGGLLRSQGLPSSTSPATGEKVCLHVVAKCGYMCVGCQETHVFVEKLRCTCPALSGQVIKRAVMCQRCDAVSDDPDTFSKQVCPVRPACSPTRAQADRFMELRMAELEMGRLIMLQTMEREQRRLQELISAKKRAETGLVPCSSHNFIDVAPKLRHG